MKPNHIEKLPPAGPADVITSPAEGMGGRGRVGALNKSGRPPDGLKAVHRLFALTAPRLGRSTKTVVSSRFELESDALDF